KFEKVFLILSSVLILLFVCATVFMRYLFKVDLYGFGEVVLLIAVWMYFIGASHGTFTKSHVNIDIVDLLIQNQNIRSGIKILSSLIVFLLCVIFSLWSFDQFLSGIESGEKSLVLRIPMYVPESSLFVGFLLMSLHSLINLIKDIKEAFFSKRELVLNDEKLG